MRKFIPKWTGLVKNEEGSQSVEFMGIAAVVIVLLVVVSGVFDSNGDDWVSGLFGAIFGKIGEIFG